MTAVEQQALKNKNREQTAVEQAPKKRRPRGKDNGPIVLPHLEHFIQMTRKVKRPSLIGRLLEGCAGSTLPALRALTDAAKEGLSIPLRDALFTAVAELDPATQARVERAAERVHLLSDEYGSLAVGDLLDTNESEDAHLLEAPTDRFSKALYLFIRQEYPGEGEQRDDRFDHAEARQAMLQQMQSEKYSSLYLGPKGAQPELGAAAEETLKNRLTELFPHIRSEDILVESFEQRDVGQAEKPVVLYTLTAMFNGKLIHYQQIANGMVEDHDEPAVTNVRYAWHATRGELAVFCDDEEVRPELAKLFRDVVLGGDGDIRTMPMREFNLMGFCTPAMLKRFKTDRIDGIESISINSLMVVKPELRQFSQRGKLIQRRVENALVIRRHRFEERDIYATASEVHGLDDLTGYVIQQVRLTMRIAKTLHRKAHNVSVQITAPNGFNDRRITKEDSETVVAQLIRLDCARQY